MSEGSTQPVSASSAPVRADGRLAAGAFVGVLAALLVIGLSWEPTHLRGVRMLPHTVTGRFPLPEVGEPSGIAFHPGRQSLFVVGDGGGLAEVSLSGAALRRRDLGLRNLEAVTVDPATGLIYVGVEEAEQILEVDPQTLDIARRFDIERIFDGRTVLAEGGAETGLEGLAFVPDAAHPEGGTFFILNQAFSDDDPNDASAILEVEAPLRSSTERRAPARIIRFWPGEIPDLSAAHWDAARRRLWVASDQLNLVMLFNPESGAFEHRWRLPGVEQEGFTLDDAGHAWIAQDVGGLIRLRLDLPDG